MHVKLTEFLTATFLESHTDRPDATKDCKICKDILDFLRNFRLLFVIDLKVGVKDTQVSIDESHFGLMHQELTVLSRPCQGTIDQVLALSLQQLSILAQFLWQIGNESLD
jgi:hypothetical protein